MEHMLFLCRRVYERGRTIFSPLLHKLASLLLPGISYSNDLKAACREELTLHPSFLLYSSLMLFLLFLQCRLCVHNFDECGRGYVRTYTKKYIENMFCQILPNIFTLEFVLRFYLERHEIDIAQYIENKALP